MAEPFDLDKLVRSGLTARPAGAGIVVNVNGPDGKPQQIPVELGTFYALDQLLATAQKILAVLERIESRGGD